MIGPLDPNPIEPVPAAGDLERSESGDIFAPPRTPIQVHCIHCNQECMSDLIWFDPSPAPGFWLCGTPGCDGIGFTFDIFPADGSHEYGGGWFDDDGNPCDPSWTDEEP